MLSRRGSSTPQHDIIFEAGEDLYSNASLMLTKSAHKRIPISRSRSSSSYCYEFCGIIGVPFSSLKFILDSRPLNFESIINSPCIIKAYHACEILQSSQNSLQPALLDLLTTGLMSDIAIYVGGQVFQAHKSILTCRSEKFNELFSDSEGTDLELQANPLLFEKMLQWIYSGNTTMPELVREVCELLMLADQYCLTDLKMRCEEDLVSKICPENVIDLMLAASHLPLVTDSLLSECNEVFVKEFNSVKELHPLMETQLATVPGLITQLLEYFHKSSSKKKKRRVTFRITEEGNLDEASNVNSGYSSTASSHA